MLDGSRFKGSGLKGSGFKGSNSDPSGLIFKVFNPERGTGNKLTFYFSFLISLLNRRPLWP
jgi:hypothetical protein